MFIGYYCTPEEQLEADWLEEEMWKVAQQYNLDYWPDAEYIEGAPACMCPDFMREIHMYCTYCPRHGLRCDLDTRAYATYGTVDTLKVIYEKGLADVC